MGHGMGLKREDRNMVSDGARIAELRKLGILDTESEDVYDRFTRLACELLHAPVSLVSLVDADRQFFKSHHGLAEPWATRRETPLTHSFCQHAVNSGEPLVVNDAREHKLFRDNEAIEDLGVIAYAGVPITLASGNTIGAFCAIDVEPRHWSQRELEILKDLAEGVRSTVALHAALAEHDLCDPLTGLYNTVYMHATARDVASRATAEDPATALVFDLDEMGLINNALGVSSGDQVLVDVARRLQREVRDKDVLGRLDGGAYCMLCTDLGNDEDALRFADRVARSISRQQFEIGGRTVDASVTAGIATAWGSDDADLLSRAYDAMRSAKRGAHAVELADSAAPGHSAELVRIRSDLRSELITEQLSLAFQPIVEINTRQVLKTEALIRWAHPELGSIRPDTFIPIAERSGSIVPIGKWVLDQSISQLARWRAAGYNDLAVSVNLAAPQLARADLVRNITSALEREGIDGSGLTIELTERMLIEAGSRQLDNLKQLRSLGVTVALDDFGTGYSSLGYISSLPIDEIKIDRSFVTGIEDDRNSAAVVEAVLTLARGLGLTVVAEGIETPAERERLQQFGCRLGQGYLFRRPANAEMAPRPIEDPVVPA